MKCKNCESEKVIITTLQETKLIGRTADKWIAGIAGCFGLWFFGTFEPFLIILGWILLIYLIFTNKKQVNVTKKLAVCQDCGTSWEVK